VFHLTDNLLQALRAMEPELRQQAIADALTLLANEERRRELMKKVETLSTDELERRLYGRRSRSKIPNRSKPLVIGPARPGLENHDRH
jgi:hypothetical protein